MDQWADGIRKADAKAAEHTRTLNRGKVVSRVRQTVIFALNH